MYHLVTVTPTVLEPAVCSTDAKPFFFYSPCVPSHRAQSGSNSPNWRGDGPPWGCAGRTAAGLSAGWAPFNPPDFPIQTAARIRAAVIGAFVCVARDGCLLVCLWKHTLLFARSAGGTHVVFCLQEEMNGGQHPTAVEERSPGHMQFGSCSLLSPLATAGPASTGSPVCLRDPNCSVLVVQYGRT